MKDFFPCQGMTSFGPNRLEPAAEPPRYYRIASPRISGLRVLVRQECPRKPGVYGMLSERGELIYVGKAKVLRARLLSYFRTKSRDPKAGHILRQTAAIVWEQAPSEFAALLRELELIHRWRPRFNAHGQPGRRRPLYLCLARQPAPHVLLSRFPIAGAVASFGPVPAGGRAREAARRLNDWFGLRDCPRPQPMIFAEEQELFPVVRAAGCLRHEIGTCLGPCIGSCSRHDYMDRVRAAARFLAGSDLSMLDTLKRQMLTASGALAYEQAGALRDQLSLLEWLHERLKHLRQAREKQSFIYPVQQRWYLIRHGYAITSVAEPSDRATAQVALAALKGVYKHQPAAPGPVPMNEIDGVFLVLAWFHRYPDERRHILSLAQALALCRTRAADAICNSEPVPIRAAPD